jgi:hypothetical protein
MAHDATLPLTQPLNCPQCGYDQRGLPLGSRCPECGTPYWVGAAMAQVNQWADRTILNLWSICVMQSIGGACLLIGGIAAALGQAAAIPIVLTSSAYVLTATLWYLVTLALFARRRRQPSFANVTDGRRASLRSWLAVDGLLCIMPIAGVYTLTQW